MWRGGFRYNISVAASFAWRCLSGSALTPFPHPAHRTGQADLPHPALGQDFTPSLSRATPSAVSERSSELIGCPISRSFATYCVCLELRSLPSTGITRLQRYYEPLRFTAARIAEQVRAGLQALPQGQIQTANALGFSRANMYRLILLPQAFRIILPTLTNEFMTIFKNTSVALTIGLVELTATAREINENTFRTFEAFGVVTMVYLVIALIAWQIMHRIERAMCLPSLAGGSSRP